MQLQSGEVVGLCRIVYEVEITMPYHLRRPVAPGAALESNRVDIGVFVHNGTYYSAPGFVTVYTLDNESRTYNERGQPLEISYGVGDVDLRVSDYVKVLLALKQADTLPSQLFQLTRGQRHALNEISESSQRLQAQAAQQQKELLAIEERSEKDDAELKNANEELANAKQADEDKSSAETKAALAAAMKKRDVAATKSKESDAAIDAVYTRLREIDAEKSKLLASTRPEIGIPIKQFVDDKLLGLLRSTALYETHRQAFQTAMKTASKTSREILKQARQRLLDSGHVRESQDGELLWERSHAESKPGAPLLPLEKFAVEGFNAALLAELVFPGSLSRSCDPNYVDHNLFTVKSWRDVYHYDDQGKPTGWTRYDGPRVFDFTEDGLMDKR